jgi:hypothetical protein
VLYVSRALEEASKTYEEMRMTVEKLCKIASSPRFEKEIHIAPS